MQQFTLLFLSGLCSLQFFSRLPGLYCCLLFIIPLSAHYLLPKSYRLLNQSVFAILLGFSWILGQSHWVLSLTLPPDSPANITVIGTIASIPEKHSHAILFNYAATQINQTHYSATHPLLMRITWYGNQPEHVRVGDKWLLHVHQTKPPWFANPGNFNYSEWLFENHINAIGSVQNRQNNLLLRVSRWRHPVDRIRQWLDEQIQYDLSGMPIVGMISALSVGIRDQITPAQWQVLRNTGTNHLMAIAGLHISCIASMVYSISHFLCRKSSRLLLKFSLQQVSAFLSLIAAIIYSGLAGFSLPTQRAVIMLSVFLMTVLLRRNISAWNAWCLALLVILICEPLCTLSSSFWLSFGTVALIIYGHSARLNIKSVWWHWGRTQWVIGLGIMPMSLLFFQQVSLVSFIANSIAIPWVGFSVLPLCFLGSLLLVIAPHAGKLIILLAAHLLNYLWILLEKCAAISSVQWHGGINQTSLMICAMLGVILLLAPRGWPARWLGFIFALPVVFYPIHKLLPGQVDVTALDAGKNEVVVIRTVNHTELYEVIVDKQKINKLNQGIIIPYLLQQNIKKVDEVLSNMPQPKQNDAPISWGMASSLSCVANQSGQWDGINWQLLTHSGESNNACDLILSAGRYNIILSGNLSAGAINKVSQLNNIVLSKSVIIMSYQKNNQLMIDGKPLLLIFGGYNTKNPINYAMNDGVLSTQQCGAIHWVMDSSGVLNTVDCYKESHQRFWDD